MEDFPQDCAPEGTATPVYNARIVQLARTGRFRRWLASLLPGAWGRGRSRKLPLLPEPSTDEGDGAWTHVHVLQHDATRHTPRTVRQLERERVAARRKRQASH